MNAKFAKELRRKTGYRNRTATPPRWTTPEVALRGYKFPVAERREVERRVWNPKTGRYDTNVVRKLVHSGRRIRSGAYWVPEIRFSMEHDSEAGTFRPASELMPVVRPVRNDPETPRGKYRVLKRACRRLLRTIA